MPTAIHLTSSARDGEKGGRLAHQPLERLVPFGVVRPHLHWKEMGHADGHTLEGSIV